jgi:peptide/nickel transport system substrate-binding protein
MRKMVFMILLLAFALSLLPAAAQQPTRLVIGIADEPEILDIQQAFGTNFATTDLITQALVWYSLESADVLVPDLVEAYALSEDGLTITWSLPENYTFSNGAPLDARAVEASIERYRAISPYAADWGELESMRVIDARTLETTFVIPPAFMSPVFSSGFGAPFDVQAAAAVGDEAFAAAPVASGPFVLESWTRGTEMRLTRSASYRTNLPFVTNKGALAIDEVLVRFIPDSLTLIAELEAGNIDIVYNVPGSAVAALENNPDIELNSVIMAGYQGIMFNTTRPPFDNLGFRRALAAALDRDILARVLEDTVLPQRSFLSVTQVSHDPAMEEYAAAAHPTDPARARQLLAEAGFTDQNGDGMFEMDGAPLRLELMVATDDARQSAVGVVVQAMLSAVGITVDIAPFTQGYIYDQMSSGVFDLAFAGYNWWDPDIMLYAFTDAGRNWPAYQNEELARLLNEGRGITDPDARRAVYSAAQRILIDDVVAIPLWTPLTYVANRTAVDGLLVHPITGHLFLNDVTIAR